MSRHRRMLYVELNRRLWLYVIPHGKKDQDDAVLWVSDFFEMSIPEPDSPYDVWLVRNLNEKHPRWLKISDYSLDEIGLYNDMTPTQIITLCDVYEQTTQPLGWIDDDEQLREIVYDDTDDTDDDDETDESEFGELNSDVGWR